MFKNRTHLRKNTFGSRFTNPIPAAQHWHFSLANFRAYQNFVQRVVDASRADGDCRRASEVKWSRPPLGKTRPCKALLPFPPVESRIRDGTGVGESTKKLISDSFGRFCAWLWTWKVTGPVLGAECRWKWKVIPTVVISYKQSEWFWVKL